MKKFIAVLTACFFVLSLGVVFAAEKQKTVGEKWKEDKHKKIDEDAKKKKDAAADKLDTGKAGVGKGKKLQDAEKKIDQETAQKKKEVDETHKKLGPAKDNPYKEKTSKDKKKKSNN